MFQSLKFIVDHFTINNRRISKVEGDCPGLPESIASESLLLSKIRSFRSNRLLKSAFRQGQEKRSPTQRAGGSGFIVNIEIKFTIESNDLISGYGMEADCSITVLQFPPVRPDQSRRFRCSVYCAAKIGYMDFSRSGQRLSVQRSVLSTEYFPGNCRLSEK